jgi:protease-4
MFLNVSLVPTIQPLVEKELSGRGNDKIVLLDLSGMLTEQERQGTLIPSPSIVAELKEGLDVAARDTAVRAVILRINSPGGTITASDILHHEVVRFKERTGKKVTAVIMDVGASGGYYVASAADRIVAHPTTVTGSIGVILLTVNFEGLLEKIGVEGQAIKSGEMKDMGSPFRSLRPEERAVFQGIIDQMYDRFVRVVSEGRGIPADEVRRIADGRVYTAPQALEHKLVDRIGYLDDAVEMTREEAGVETARLVTYHRPGSYKNNIYSAVNPSPVTGLIPESWRMLLTPGVPRLMYLWLP